MKTLIILFLLFFSLEAFSKIRFKENHTAINSIPTNIDIDQNGLWDAKIYRDAWNNYQIILAYQDASNYTAIRVISATQKAPVPFPYEAAMVGVGASMYITDESPILIENFSQQGTKYIGIKLIKNGISYCSWIQVYNGSGSMLELGSYAWEDDNTKCLWAGQTINASILISQNIDVSVSPNPAADLIFINGNPSAVDVDIYNSLGEKILSFNQVYSNVPLDISSLPTGIYYIFIQENNASIRKKLIVNR